MEIIIYGIALIVGVYAYMDLLTQATLGVGTIAFAILLAILARLVQANAHHRDEMKFWTAQSTAPTSDPPRVPATDLPARPIDRNTTFPSVG